MKILTNIRFAQTAGIAQNLRAFLSFVGKNKKDTLEVVGVNVMNHGKETYKKIKKGNISMVTIGTSIPSIKNVLYKVKNLKGVEKEYARVIRAYRQAIEKEKPDLILINGTYYMPWCLFSAIGSDSIPTVLHYHGLLTKETEGWRKKQRGLFKKMEQSFDKENLFYIFPSDIARKTVENEVFGHKIKKYSVLPSPVPLYFFDSNGSGSKKNIGIVSRWTSIKNTEFYEDLIEYNKNNGNKFVINIITDLNKKDRRYKALSQNAKFWSPRSNKGLVKFYQNMGVVISPSFFETYGNVAKEAIASGVPAIVSSNMGVSETFKKLGLKSWVNDFSSIKRVYCEIENIVGKKVKNNTRSAIKKLYSPEKIFNEMIDILAYVESAN